MRTGVQAGDPAAAASVGGNEGGKRRRHR